MKTLFSYLAVLLVFASVRLGAPKVKRFSGEIMDSACAMAGSHDGLM